MGGIVNFTNATSPEDLAEVFRFAVQESGAPFCRSDQDSRVLGQSLARFSRFSPRWVISRDLNGFTQAVGCVVVGQPDFDCHALFICAAIREDVRSSQANVLLLRAMAKAAGPWPADGGGVLAYLGADSPTLNDWPTALPGVSIRLDRDRPHLAVVEGTLWPSMVDA